MENGPFIDDFPIETSIFWGIFHSSAAPRTNHPRNSVPFGMAPWEPSTEAGYEPEMVMCLGNHGQLGKKGGWWNSRMTRKLFVLWVFSLWRKMYEDSDVGWVLLFQDMKQIKTNNWLNRGVDDPGVATTSNVGFWQPRCVSNTKISFLCHKLLCGLGILSLLNDILTFIGSWILDDSIMAPDFPSFGTPLLSWDLMSIRCLYMCP